MKCTLCFPKARKSPLSIEDGVGAFLSPDRENKEVKWTGQTLCAPSQVFSDSRH